MNFLASKSSVRKSIEYTDTLFNILRDILIEDNPIQELKLEILVFLNQNLLKQNLELEILLLMKKFMYQLTKNSF